MQYPESIEYLKKLGFKTIPVKEVYTSIEDAF